jgi:hypothetical protein
MPPESDFDPELIRGLQALALSTFPKVCRCCGRQFADVTEYTKQTLVMPNGKQGLKQSYDDDGQVIVDFFRNCPCGSTLMDSFNDRRNLTPAGLARRQRFGELLDYLIRRGLDAVTARHELLTVLQGGQSEILKKFRPPAKKN